MLIPPALQKAGNSNYRVELLPGVDHYMAAARTSCLTEHIKTFEQVLIDQGYGSLEEAGTLIMNEPGKLIQINYDSGRFHRGKLRYRVILNNGSF